MSDWEPVEVDLPVGAGDNLPSLDTSKPSSVRRNIDLEVIEAKFESQRDALAFVGHDGAIRSEGDNRRLFDRREFKEGTVERVYYHYDSSSGQFIGRARVTFYGAESKNMNSEDLKKYVEGGISIGFQFRRSAEKKGFNWYGEAVNVRLSFGVKNILYYDTNDNFDFGYDEEGKLVKVENNQYGEDGPTDSILITNEGEYLDTIMGREVEVVGNNSSSNVSWVYDQEKKAGFFRLDRYDHITGEGVSILIPARINPDLKQQLIPLPEFSDPYSTDPEKDSSWLKSDWKEILGGLSWEMRMPEIADEDTELPGK